MKTSVFKMVALVFLCSICLTAVNCVFAAGEKIAYMDLGKIFDDYNKTKDFDKELEKKSDFKQAERDKLVAEIKKLKDEIDLMSDKAKEPKQAAIDDKIKKLQDFDRDTRDALRKERDDMARRILKEIKDVIDGLGKKEGYSLILDSRAVLYGAEGDDLTNSVSNDLNDRYSKGK
ncbi:MAG: OmpH family outer membrane protein [Candidatus Omnitrophota bacterium]